MRPSLKLLVLSLPFLLILSGTALANTCNSFATYSCAKGVHNGAFIGGCRRPTLPPRRRLLLVGRRFNPFPPQQGRGVGRVMRFPPTPRAPTDTHVRHDLS